MCFYADVTHGNLIYECGIRYVVADGYQPFWIALSFLIVASVVVLFFLARGFYKHILKKDPVTDMEMNDMRNIVHLIREKRSM
ncbi:unnamed protein product [Larinioides sclopetarius]|uniref:Uncharacterized protein n=1 Tax=Larinioides sclopetarius TaxID=280406 RepID=A0AAV2B491_9ARAC